MKPYGKSIMAIMIVLLALIQAACGTELTGGVNANTFDSSGMLSGVTSSGSGGSTSVAYMQGDVELNKNIQVNDAQLQSTINLLSGTIQNAVDGATDGDTIIVWPGLYKENVKIGKSLSITGIGAIGALLTKVDGQGLGSVFETTDTVDLTLSKMTIRNGGGIDCWTGGGINDLFGGHLKVDSCILTNNHCQWGGAIFQYNGELEVSNSKFIGNSADACGGAIQIQSDKATINNCEFRENIAHGWGGAINAPSVCVDGLFVSNSQFYQNSADGTLYGGTEDGYGGAISSGTDANIRNSKFEGNMALNGGAIGNYPWMSDITTTVEDCYLKGNTATNMGGGIYTGSPLTVKGDIIIKNKAAIGGGIYWGGGIAPTITGSLILGNTPDNVAHA